MLDCDCSDEYGPCEQHCEVLVIREGASLRTADELAIVRIGDMISCGAKATFDEAREILRLETALENSRDSHSGLAWFANDDDSESAFDLVSRIESTLPDGVQVYSEDGYSIVRLSPDCPLFDDSRADVA